MTKFLYKRFHPGKVVAVSNMQGLQWFALTSDYGEESYGPIVHTYSLKKKLKLLNLGKMKNRENIVSELSSKVPNISRIMDPDEQYSGGSGNKRIHKILHQYYGQQYDGTIIEDEKVDHVDLEGPTEVVLWKNFRDLIRKV